MSEENKDARLDTDEYIQVLPAVAKNIYLPCRKCEVNRYFKVLAHKTERSARLECEVCGVKKSFTIKKPRKTPVKKGGKPSAKGLYESMLNEIGPSSAVPYSMRSSYKENTAIDHAKFGLGFVRESNTVKIQVVFSDEVRDLVHNRP